MQRWDRLNERQAELLRRIADGDDLSTPDGVPYRISARALQGRRLVAVARKGGTWRATITEAGRFYLEHGFHPDDPAHVARPSPTRPRREAAGVSQRPPAAASIDGAGSATLALAQQLVDQLDQGDGVVRVEEPDEQTRARYRRAIHAAKQHKLVPDGYELRHTGRDRNDIVVMLYNKANGANNGWDAFRIASRHQTTIDDEIIAALQKNPSALTVSAELLPRALEFVRLLAAAARSRGHRLVVNTKGARPTLSLRLEKSQRAVRISEEYDKVPHVLTDDERRRQKRQPWISLPEFDRVRSGRLVLEVNRAGYGKSDTWTDDKRTTLESRVHKIVKEVEAGYLADQREQEERERVRLEEEERWERRKAEERAQWEQVKATATVLATDKLRTDRFRAAFDSWVAADAIRSFCTALEGSASSSEAAGQNLDQWVAWARNKADRLDPTINPAVLAEVDFDIEPRPRNLEPFMGEWSAARPEKAYRSEATRSQYADILAYEKTWHHGMRGSPQAWRWRS
ncbi:hypothetical protein U2F26_33495 [Micromonospora sp. 4G57]|uniref:PE-PGRS family protein n=1 Tax=Micromonospora sicca TaxID=2202420 RepID=A0ABU5JPI1_9ACTN|nr:MULTISPECIES: hypothetical protein [unclassified Micromonospora]MDZ5447565.1 hypothetical protein [Micromonospora sp. 4G57]MDZ5494279.1 hypothetical protein [Micromonospora sp. 4G53]